MFTPLQEITIIMLNHWENVAEMFSQRVWQNSTNFREEWRKRSSNTFELKKTPTNRIVANVENDISR